jgi:hypothetical protein
VDPHDLPPHTAPDLPPEALAAFQRIQSSNYFALIAPLKELVVGRRVTDSVCGHSGFLLKLDDGTWVMSFLTGEGLLWTRGPDDGSIGEQLNLMYSPEYGDGASPLSSQGPYSDGRCDLTGEVAKAHGQVIEKLAFGERTFNFCFPGGRELDTSTGTSQDGKLALRAFWEQW